MTCIFFKCLKQEEIYSVGNKNGNESIWNRRFGHLGGKNLKILVRWLTALTKIKFVEKYIPRMNAGLETSNPFGYARTA